MLVPLCVSSNLSLDSRLKVHRWRSALEWYVEGMGGDTRGRKEDRRGRKKEM